MKAYLKFTLTVSVCFISTIAYGQGLPNPPATPIDGGLGLLLAGGIAYGIRKLAVIKKGNHNSPAKD